MARYEIPADAKWTIESKQRGEWKETLPGAEFSTDGVIKVLFHKGGKVTYFSSPSLYHHWGYLLLVENNGKEYRATTKDFALTETYLSA